MSISPHPIPHLIIAAMVCTLTLPAWSQVPSTTPAEPAGVGAIVPPKISVPPTATQPAMLPHPQTPEEIQERYARVLGILKRPPATGVLIAEFNPNSMARAAGCMPGDIITNYGDEEITSENLLRRAVSQGIAEFRINDALPESLPLIVRRPTMDRATGLDRPIRVALSVSRGPLGVTALAVEAGVPATSNPPPTPRDDLTLLWDILPTIEPPPGKIFGHELWTRLYLGPEFYGYERTRLEKAGRTWALGVVSTMVQDRQIIGTQTCTIIFSPSDNRTTPGFTLESVDLEDALQNTRTTLEKKGLTIRGGVDPMTPPAAPDIARHQDLAAPTIVIGAHGGVGLVPVFAAPLVASVLPHEKDIVVPFAQLSEVDAATRLGFCFRTLGRRVIPPVNGVGQRQGGDTKPADAWAVEVLHFGRTEQTFYFDDQCVLVQAQLGGNLTAQRVKDEGAAQQGLLPTTTQK